MLIVISNPTAVKEEATIINKLFDEGMELFHLRKPLLTMAEIWLLLKEIKPKYYSRIVLHQDHELANDFKINRLHFTGEKRKATKEDVLIEFIKKGYIISTSIHTIKEYQNISPYFNYSFFGPVFNSLSKQGYMATISGDFIFPIENDRPKVIAIGGIKAKNIRQTIQMDFNGVAVLGTIWENPGKSVRQFKILQKIWKQAGQ
jgi:thiamine-phosphate pyrophosphorylase